MSEVLAWIRNSAGHFHPALVHFPIALLLTGAALESRRLLMRSGGRSETGWILLCLGAAGAAGAIATGLLLFHPGDFQGRTLEVVRIHRALGLVAGMFSVAAVAVGGVGGGRTPGAGRLRLYRALYLVAAVLVGLAGHYGGWIVFGWGRIWTF